MDNIIEIKDLSKSFGDVKAVDNISFSVEKGSLFAFLGINGAGKSTTISMICGSLSPDSGEITLYGGKNEYPGVVFQSSKLDTAFTVYDNLKYRASLYGIYGREFKKRLDELSELLELREILNRPVGKLSGGQRRKADIARALFHKPSLLILDEPTTGLDVQTRKTIWSVVDKLRREESLTVLLTTHYMEEATDADYVVIMDGGKIIAEGTPLELKNKYTTDTVTLYSTDENQVKTLGIPYVYKNGAFVLSVKNTSQIKELIEKYPDVFEDFEVTKGKMDDVFLSVTGKDLKEVTSL